MIKDQHIIDILNSDDQNEKVVYLDDDRILKVSNIAWGYDVGDDFAHITTNISPEIKNADIDFLYTNNIYKIEDSTNGITLYERKKKEI